MEIILSSNLSISNINNTVGAQNSSKGSDSRKLNVYVIDVFKFKTEDIDGDQIPDVSHGDYCKALVKNNNDNINVNIEDCSDENDPHSFDVKKLSLALSNLQEKIKNGDKIDAINISLSSDVHYDKVNPGQKGYRAINEINLDNKKAEVLRMFKQSSKEEDNELVEVVNKLESIAQSGVQICIAAGNHKNSFNLLGLVKEAKVIGAGYENFKSKVFPSNSTIDVYEQPIIKSNLIKNNNNFIGVDVSNNGIVDFSKEECSDKTCEDSSIGQMYTAGTSFTTAIHLNKILEEKLKQSENN